MSATTVYTRQQQELTSASSVALGHESTVIGFTCPDNRREKPKPFYWPR